MPTKHPMNYTSLDDEQAISWNMRNISLPTLGDSTAGCSINFALDSVAPTDTERFQLGYWEPSQPSRNYNVTSAFAASDCGSPTLYGVVIEGDVLRNNSVKASKAVAFACSRLLSQQTHPPFGVLVCLTSTQNPMSTQNLKLFRFLYNIALSIYPKG
ncbi:hypothetical protein BDV33DRAFT_108124 [Aspergillus novoparasiticus]|uniref:Uncharacterized protein n=1 Tax=Aspergillus novoparasiticus TaxID=986946 RepID=A0A5N6ERQ7_9EURO|nr:hypothetical protein BDV33DRAFT_108124 [Aspergillus novoparasiticus]